MIHYRNEPERERIGIAAVVYSVYCALLPLNMILNFTGFTVNKYFGIFSAALFLIDILRKRNYSMKRDYLVFLCFLAWSWITILWTIHFGRSLNQLITMSSLVLITEMGLLRGLNEKEIKLVKYSMIIPSALIVFYLAPNIEVSHTRATLASSVQAADHNSLAANILFALLICINEIKYEPKRWLKIICIVCAVSMSISILLIASRGAYVAAVISVLLYFILERRDAGKTISFNLVIKRFFIILVIAAIAILVFRNVAFPALRRLQFDELFTNTGYGRTNLWSATWRALWDSSLRVLFGYGYGTEPYITHIYTGLYAGIHNVYLEHWATTGIIGLILLLAIFIRPLIFAWKNRDNLSVVLIIALMIVCFPLGFLTNKGAWNVLMLAYIGLQNTKPRPAHAEPEDDEPEDFESEDDESDGESEDLEPKTAEPKVPIKIKIERIEVEVTESDGHSD